MQISDLGIQLVKGFEGLYLESYLDTADVWTIGWGHTGEVDGQVLDAGMMITEEKAIELFKLDMQEFEEAVTELITVPLQQHQFDALVTFTYNVGKTALRTSTLRKLLNAGNYEAVPEQMNRWNKSGGRITAGLVRRRKSEGHLFATGELDFFES